MKSLPVFASALVGMIATGSAATFNFTLQDAFKVGLFAENNASFGNSESEGTVVVGGDLTTGGSPWQVRLQSGAYLLNSAEGNPSSANDDFGLVVGGNMTIGAADTPGIRMSASVAYGGNTFAPGTPPVSPAPPGYINLTDLSSSQAPGGTPVASRAISAGSTVNMTQAFNDLKTVSAQIAAMAATDPGTRVASVNGSDQLVFSGKELVYNSELFGLKGFYLYNILASDVSKTNNNPSAIAPQFNSATDIIVFNIINNVAGSGGTANFNLDLGLGTVLNYDALKDLTPAPVEAPSVWSDNFLWNISDPGLAFANQKSFIGTLLAPNSTFTQGGPAVEGAFIVGSYNGSNAGELHPIVGGSLIANSVVPEPTTAVAGVLLALGLVRRKRR